MYSVQSRKPKSDLCKLLLLRRACGMLAGQVAVVHLRHFRPGDRRITTYIHTYLEYSMNKNNCIAHTGISHRRRKYLNDAC